MMMRNITFILITIMIVTVACGRNDDGVEEVSEDVSKVLNTESIKTTLQELEAVTTNKKVSKTNTMSQADEDLLDIVEESGKLIDLITPGRHNASVMLLAIPEEENEEAERLAYKFQDSLQKNLEWFYEYMEKYGGDELPWHENMGLSQEEYEKFLELRDRMQLEEIANITIEITETDVEGCLLLNHHVQLPYLSDTVFDLNGNQLLIKSRWFTFVELFEETDENETTGAWSGGTWILEFEKVPESYNFKEGITYGTVTVNVGRVHESNKVMLVFKERVHRDGVAYEGSEIVIIND